MAQDKIVYLNQPRQDANTSREEAGTGCSKKPYFSTAANILSTLSVSAYASLIWLRMRLQVALGLGKQVSRRIQKGTVVVVATTTCSVHWSLLSLKVHHKQQWQLQRLCTSKASAARRTRFCSSPGVMESVKSGLGSPLCSNEDGGAAVQQAWGWGPKRHVRESTYCFQSFAQDTNCNIQNGALATEAAWSLPTSYRDHSTTESGEEEVHVAFVLVYCKIPAFHQWSWVNRGVLNIIQILSKFI